MNIIGLSAFFHESACCLIRDGAIVAAAEEERFSRIKHDPSLPRSAFKYCLDAGGLRITDVDSVAYYESPIDKLGRQIWSGRSRQGVAWLDPEFPFREIRESLGFEGPIESFPHHLSHAASAFFCSGFPEAAILTVDGVGEWATTTYGRGEDRVIELLEQVEFPHSLGLFYSTITAYLGFAVNSGEYKVMGLAPYGQPRYLDRLRRLLRSTAGGQFELDLEYFDFIHGERMFSERLPELLGQAPRAPGAELSDFHRDVARSAQGLLEEMLLEKVRHLHDQVGSSNLCMAGGVALNCVANGRVLREGPFAHLFVQPAAGDSGGCLGAALLAHAKLTGERPSTNRLQHVYLGPEYSSASIAAQLNAAGVRAFDFRARQVDLLEAVVDRLVDGRVIGWFHGRMEFGPRALGARSILADPRDPSMRDRLNHLVKKREDFRPFAPSVLLEKASEHFALDHTSPFMLETCAVQSAQSLPAITHVDGSARPQTVDARWSPRFAALIERFDRRTGCPVLVNTSFNVRDEPIVCSPADALSCMIGADLDALVLEDFLIDREMVSDALRRLVLQSSRVRAREASISTVLYTFV